MFGIKQRCKKQDEPKEKQHNAGEKHFSSSSDGFKSKPQGHDNDSQKQDMDGVDGGFRQDLGCQKIADYPYKSSSIKEDIN
ncbi:hypothetical protein D3C73_1334280 [compost metagenome]